jgi:hypothetical protein
VSLDALAPDQRAVVQLVLQQDRSYEDLAGLLGITAAAVRERAHNGLERLAPTEGVSDDERAAVSDYLLGQQSVSRREATRALLSTSGTARAWAQAVRAELAEVARGPLPDVPASETARAAAEPEDAPDPFEPDEGPFVPDEAEEPAADRPVIADPLTETPADEPAPTRARPRPRREPVPDYGFDAPEEETDDRLVPGAAAGARTSRLGGALLIAGLGIFVAALIVWLVTRGDDGDKTSAGTTTTEETATPSPTATPDFQAIGALALRSADGDDARGQMILFAAQGGEVAFNIKARNVPPSEQGEAYGVWLTGGEENHFLGFTPPVGDDGRLAVSGPRERDQRNFARWFTESPKQKLVVSVETQEGATSPGPLVLTGDVKDLITASGATATPTP